MFRESLTASLGRLYRFLLNKIRVLIYETTLRFFSRNFKGKKGNVVPSLLVSISSTDAMIL
jgi:hypothetical protein